MKALSFTINFIKSFVLVMILSTNSYAFFFGGGSSTGTESSPIELIVDGDKRDDDSPTQYYSFYSTVNQNITSHITDHGETTTGWGSVNRDLTLTLYNLKSDGTCDTSISLGSIKNDGNFNWTFSANGGQSYCLEVNGDSTTYIVNRDYDIHLTGDASLEAGVSDTSKKEDDSPMEFIVALTKAATSDVTISYTFSDGTAVNGTNYTGTNGSVTIHTGEQTAVISVPLKDTKMTTTKTFSVSITSSDVSVDTDSSRATGSIIGSGSVDADTDDPNYNGPDICYDSRETSGFCMFGSCMFYQERTNVRAMVNGLEDIDIKKALTRGISFMDFGSEIGTNDNKKTLDPDDDQAEKTSFHNEDFMGYYNASMFPNGANYRVGNGADENNGGSLDKDETTSYYDKSMFKFGLFTQYTTLVTYQKGGTTYQEVLQACDPDTHGSLDAKPTLNDCGIFLGALNSNTEVKFSSSTWQTINNQTELYTPKISGTTGLCSGSTCSVGDGIGTMSLPTFINSQENSTSYIPYSMVIAEQHVGHLVVKSDANTESSEDNRTIVFEAPYSSSYGARVMLIKSISQNNDNHANKYHYVFKEGDYWIGSWNIDEQKEITIETTGNVRFFINGDFSIKTTGSGEIRMGYNPAVTSTTSCTDPHFYMYVAGDWELDSAGAAHIKNGYIYAKGKMDIGSATFASYYTSLTADGQIDVKTTGSGAYTAGDASGVCKDNTYLGLFDECPAAGPASYLTGPFDAWDTFRDASTPPSDRNISTKVVNTLFKLSLASLNKNSDDYETKNGDVDVAIYPKNSTKAISNHYTFHTSSTAHVDSDDFNVSIASKDVVVGFKLCTRYENNATTNLNEYILYPSSDCSAITTVHDCNATTAGTPTWHICYSSDNFAIRPKEFKVVLPSTISKAQDVNISYSALDGVGNPSKDYNESISSLSLNATIADSSKSCENNSMVINTTKSFSDGAVSELSNLGRVAKWNIKLKEKSGSEFANVDIDDTSDINRYIKSTDINLTVIPHHFTISNLPTDINADSNFTYISNDLDNMGVKLSFRVTAQNDQNGTTANYANGCYANQVSLDIGFVNVSNMPSKMLSKELNTSIETNATTSTNKLQIISLPVVLFSNDHNGSADLNLSINFPREKNNPINPFRVKFNDINITDTSASIIVVTDSSGAIDKNATMIYGRTHATKQRYAKDSNPATSDFDANVKVFFEAFCYGSGCDTTLLPDGSHQTDDLRWYRNTKHDANKDGNIGVVTDRYSIVDADAPTYTNSNEASVDLHYDTSQGLPYGTTMENNASSWLLYDKNNPNTTKNEFSVEFEAEDSGWSGEHETDVTIKDRNITQKTNRRSMW